tara:strand:- start:12 stop:272 length:261 start_codon:yes stop_codon:yes gene_type:complete
MHYYKNNINTVDLKQLIHNCIRDNSTTYKWDSTKKALQLNRKHFQSNTKQLEKNIYKIVTNGSMGESTKVQHIQEQFIIWKVQNKI